MARSDRVAADLPRGSGGVFRRRAISRESPVHQRQVGGLEPTVAREHVCGPDVISTATVNGAREGARIEIMSVGCPQTAGRASRSGQVPDYLSRNIPSAYAPPLYIRRAERRTRKSPALHSIPRRPKGGVREADALAGVSTVTRTVAAHYKANQHCAEGLGTDPAKVIFYKKFAFLSE